MARALLRRVLAMQVTQQRTAVQSPELVFQSFRAEWEPGIVRVLHTAFGDQWGDRAYWRWKNSSRPGFSPLDVTLVTQAEMPVACFHRALRSLQMGPGLSIACSVEGDFAIEPGARRRGLPRRAYAFAATSLMERSVVLRGGFSSPELFERFYKPTFGHRMVPTVTAQYRKILSDKLLREKLLEFGDRVRLHPRLRMLLEQRPLTVRLEITGFQPCDLVLGQDGTRCTDSSAARPDLWVRAPYPVLAASRLRRSQAMLLLARKILSRQLRVRGLMRLLGRLATTARRL
ncbi:MAG TPA: hypothetical protein VI653_09825 [Steroidobacteraceae bacterium]